MVLITVDLNDARPPTSFRLPLNPVGVARSAGGCDHGEFFMAWNDRFKQKSAAAHREPLPRRKFDDELIRVINDASPIGWLSNNYSPDIVRHDERKGRIAIDKILRADKTDKGWRSCDWEGNGIGDNIQLYRYVKGVDFVTAVKELSNTPIEQVNTHRSSEPAKIEYPRLPPIGGTEIGRKYLIEERGISPDTIKHAEAAGVIRYSDSGIIFLGKDENGSVRAANIRYFKSVEIDGDLINKRDFKNSDKSYPAIIPGSLNKIAVVEGGVNGLAVRDLAIKNGEEPPTIVVSGGVLVMNFVRDNDIVKNLIKNANEIVIFAENEKDKNGDRDIIKQEKTDAARRKLEVLISVTCEKVPTVKYPPENCKDAADWLRHVVNERKNDNEMPW